MMIEKIMHESCLIAMILREISPPEGIEFYTADDSALQIGAMTLNTGFVIAPHVHRTVERIVSRTQEVLVVQKGKVRVDLYDDQKVYLESRIIEEGDVIFLSSGGHGFTIIEDAIMIEVKTGPFVGEHDKTRYEPFDKSRLNVKN